MITTDSSSFRRTRWIGTLVSIAVTTTAVSAHTILYVDDDAPPGGDGQTWDTAYRYLQDALAAAGSETEIRVAQGTYAPDRNEASPGGSGDREATFQLVGGAAVMGGYAGTAAHDPDGRDIDAHVTILTGDLLGNDEAGSWAREDNAYHVVTGSGTGATAVIDGFTVTAGFPPAEHFYVALGGGGMLNVAASPTIRRCTFTGNGEVVWWDNGEFGFATVGGGMSNVDGSSPTIEDCTFAGNAAAVGGGMFNRDSSPIVTGCLFQRNNGRFGGAVCNDDDDSSPTFAGCTFAANEAVFDGGGIWSNRDSHPVVLQSSFLENSAGRYGGAMADGSGSAAVITDCSFIGCTAGYTGGGVYGGTDGATEIAGSSFCDNFPFHVSGDWIDQGGNDFCPLCDPSSGDVLGVPGPYPTIRAAVAAACDGAEIVVAPGTYTERVNFAGKAITLRSSAGPEATVLEGLPDGAVVICMNAEGRGSVLEGFTITGGGPGMYNDGSSPTVRNCTVLENHSHGYEGGGMLNRDADPLVIGCRFVRNTVSPPTEGGVGGGMFNDASDPTLIGCLFAGNRAAGFIPIGGGIANSNGSSPAIIGCAFVGNEAWVGAAVYNGESSPTVINCTFAPYEDAFDSTFRSWDSDPFLVSCIFWGSGEEQIEEGGGTVMYSDVQGGYEGTGNIDADPLFVRNPDPGADGEWCTVDDDYGDLRLSAGSPCIDAGANNAVPTDGFDLDDDGDTAERLPLDLDGDPRFADDAAASDTGCGTPVVVDMGAYELQGDPVHPVLVGDADGDGLVGFGDLLEVLAAWGECEAGCCLADVDYTLEVDLSDLLIVLSNWS